MKTKLSIPALGILALVLSFSACKKSSSDKEKDADYTTEASVQADDQNRVSAEIEAVANDADGLLESTAGFTARQEHVESIICDATVTADTTAATRTIIITYNGNNCWGNRTRTGTVTISMAQGLRWKNTGAAVSISFQNLKITRVIDNKSITINGTKTYTNTSGGLVINLATLPSVTHTITSSNLSVTFDDGSVRNWQLAHQRVFTYSNGLVITTTGTHTEGSITNIAEWGMNRFNHAFTTAVTQPVVVRQSCNFRVTSGELSYNTALFKASALFGLDASGNATACPGIGNYFLKLTWSGLAGINHTVIAPY